MMVISVIMNWPFQYYKGLVSQLLFLFIPTVIGSDGFLSIPQIEEMARSKMQLGSHSLTHPYFVTLGDQEIKREVCESKIQIQKILNNKVNHFCVPFGFYNKQMGVGG